MTHHIAESVCLSLKALDIVVSLKIYRYIIRKICGFNHQLRRSVFIFIFIILVHIRH